MQEIFEVARRYAEEAAAKKNFDVLYDHGFDMDATGQPAYESLGEWRLHKQALKVLKMAVEHCAKRSECGQYKILGSMDDSNIIAEIDRMETAYGEGWEQEGQWHIKDYESADDLIETLSFIRRMGVYYERKDRNSLSEARHLRLSNDDFDLIFNPVQDVERTRGRGFE